MINKNIIYNFSNVIGYLEIAVSLETFKRYKKEYNDILNTLLKWVNYYFEKNNFDIITKEESLNIHEMLENIKWNLITNKDTKSDSMLSDDILIRYEVLVKSINEERDKQTNKKVLN